MNLWLWHWATTQSSFMMSHPSVGNQSPSISSLRIILSSVLAFGQHMVMKWIVQATSEVKSVLTFSLWSVSWKRQRSHCLRRCKTRLVICKSHWICTKVCKWELTTFTATNLSFRFCFRWTCQSSYNRSLHSWKFQAEINYASYWIIKSIPASHRKK